MESSGFLETLVEDPDAFLRQTAVVCIVLGEH